ncbi:hypothetical protein FQR65_LT04884 [Abscondita terminalis]|nr:hypothetical protein FQR65_LT04884 [Abscondita terminalis]
MSKTTNFQRYEKPRIWDIDTKALQTQLVFLLLPKRLLKMFSKKASKTEKKLIPTSTQPSPLIYFAYGSNLLKERLARSVEASRQGIGKIKDYRLDFGYFSKRWNGSVATIVPDPGREVWVAIWHVCGFEKLDEQEGVQQNVYERFVVDVERLDGGVVTGYTYMLTRNPEEYVPLDALPKNRQPSKAYLDVILSGAKQSELPEYYQEKLREISHNNYDGQVRYDLV